MATHIAAAFATGVAHHTALAVAGRTGGHRYRLTEERTGHLLHLPHAAAGVAGLLGRAPGRPRTAANLTGVVPGQFDPFFDASSHFL